MKIKDINKVDLIERSIKIEGEDSLKLGSKIFIVKSNYNSLLNISITNGIINELNDIGVPQKEIGLLTVPGGAFELPLAIKELIEKMKPSVVIAVGCIIKGETKHYEFLSSTVINALRNISFETKTPIINGILTTETIEQAVKRAGKKINKGQDFARAAIEIKDFYKKLKQ